VDWGLFCVKEGKKHKDPPGIILNNITLVAQGEQSGGTAIREKYGGVPFKSESQNPEEGTKGTKQGHGTTISGKINSTTVEVKT